MFTIFQHGAVIKWTVLNVLIVLMLLYYVKW
jgi:hypothetical protein